MKSSNDDNAEWMQANVERVFAAAVPSRWRPDTGSIYHPPTDVFETDDHLVVIVEIAGLQESSYELTLTSRSLTVRGHRRDPSHKLAYQQMEIRYGDFQTQIYLPGSLNLSTDDIDAIYDQGFLRIRVKKARTRRIPVRSDASADVLEE